MQDDHIPPTSGLGRRILEALLVVAIIIVGGVIVGLQVQAPVQPPEQHGSDEALRPTTPPRLPSVPDQVRAPQGQPADPEAGDVIRLRPMGDPAAWITADDYPNVALRDNLQGNTTFALTVDSAGHPTRCDIRQSSGHAVLDNAVCQALMRRARFSPGRDLYGKPVGGTYSSRVVWRIP